MRFLKKGIFTDEQMIEIGRVREGLEAMRDRIQPYPIEEDASPEKPREQIVIHRTSNTSKLDWDLLQQTARKVGWLEKKLLEREKPRQRPPTKTPPRVYEFEK